MKKFLFCSLGNIMQRHFRNLKKVSPNCEINLYLPKNYNEHRIFDNKLNISYTNNLKSIYDINYIFYDLDEALDAKIYDAVFIGTLPPKRVDIAIKVAEKGLNLFIEKPLSNNLDKVYKLNGIVEENKLKCALGFQMRFSPIIEEIKQMVDGNIFGDIYRIEVNHYNNIHNWSKGRELKDFYAMKDGILLVQAVHEIDYLTYIFGKHYPISAIYENWLNTEVEDNITILSNLENNNGCIPIIINLDFLSKVPRRDLTIYGIEKIESFDLLPHSSEEWNNLFLDEMKTFLNLLNGYKDDRLSNLEDGIASLEYIMDIKDNFMKVNI